MGLRKGAVGWIGQATRKNEKKKKEIYRADTEQKTALFFSHNNVRDCITVGVFVPCI